MMIHPTRLLLFQSQLCPASKQAVHSLCVLQLCLGVVQVLGEAVQLLLSSSLGGLCISQGLLLLGQLCLGGVHLQGCRPRQTVRCKQTTAQ